MLPALAPLLLLLLASLAGAAAQQVTPPSSLLGCLPAALTIGGGVAPYTVSVLPGAQVSGEPLEVLPPVTASGSVTWLVDVPAGQQVTFAVRDANGTVGYSAPVEILPGDTADCIGANASSRSESLVPTSASTGRASALTAPSSSARTTTMTDSASTESDPSTTSPSSSSSSPPLTTTTSTGSPTHETTTVTVTASDARDTGANLSSSASGRTRGGAKSVTAVLLALLLLGGSFN
ncbi:hypothetical protein DMC30DRAFT_414574 [Rhodotorula diobovata]|uniref:Ser-Thr-rich glycosyl-phosphatidyl-inositol-anchored membrane family-domain-containing protein n=1 Tax=Rhodotorula diobovata TaxID=5288 RepID=A0A5C5G3U0_9BASI|nr:hypothetical protein DMC30DRAFT_414574 [Rhodotorula diobovata]